MKVSELIELLMDNLDLDAEIDIMRSYYDGGDTVYIKERPSLVFERGYGVLVPDSNYEREIAKHEFFALDGDPKVAG